MRHTIAVFGPDSGKKRVAPTRSRSELATEIGLVPPPGPDCTLLEQLVSQGLEGKPGGWSSSAASTTASTPPPTAASPRKDASDKEPEAMNDENGEQWEDGKRTSKE